MTILRCEGKENFIVENVYPVYGRNYPLIIFTGSINQRIIHKIGFKASS